MLSLLKASWFWNPSPKLQPSQHIHVNPRLQTTISTSCCTESFIVLILTILLIRDPIQNNLTPKGSPSPNYARTWNSTGNDETLKPSPSLQELAITARVQVEKTIVDNRKSRKISEKRMSIAELKHTHSNWKSDVDKKRHRERCSSVCFYPAIWCKIPQNFLGLASRL